jgi:hypothetical protein
LGDGEALLTAYRARCSSVSDSNPTPTPVEAAADALAVLADLEGVVRTEAHAMELERALQGKLAGSSNKDRAALLSLAARTELWNAHVQRITLDLHCERITKQWIVYAPEPSSSSDAAGQQRGVHFEAEWSTSRHSGRTELAPFAYHTRLLATPFSLVPSTTEPDEPPTREDEPTVTLLDISDTDQSRVDVAALARVQAELAPSPVTKQQWAWFVAFMASHPTDLAVSLHSTQPGQPARASLLL